MDPLEYKNGIKIYVVPEYSKQPNLNTQLLDNAVGATTVRANLNNISLIKIWLRAFNEYMAIKEGMAAGCRVNSNGSKSMTSKNPVSNSLILS